MLSSSFGLDPVIEARLREIGSELDPGLIQEMRDLFAEDKDLSLPAGGVRHDDVPYATHPRQMIDICSPGAKIEGGAPVVVFVPGGGLVGGDKQFYAHIPAFFARQGFVGVAMNYRLAPDYLFPAGAEDVSAVIDWIGDNIGPYGGDPTRICFVAQSAGAIHASSALFDRRVRARHHHIVRAAILMSGVYEIVPDHEERNINLYFGNDPAELADRAPVNHVQESDVPVILTVSEIESAFFGRSAAALMAALTKRNQRPLQLVWLKGHNHLSAVLNLGGRGDELGPAIADTLRTYL